MGEYYSFSFLFLIPLFLLNRTLFLLNRIERNYFHVIQILVTVCILLRINFGIEYMHTNIHARTRGTHARAQS